ncbi:hypothetical protein SRO_6348 [Streptomyces rochei]|nr:hypothetical protein SRO_6348 [Streptomyces rochei]
MVGGRVRRRPARRRPGDRQHPCSGAALGAGSEASYDTAGPRHTYAVPCDAVSQAR